LPPELDSARHVRFDRPAVHSDRSSKSAQAQHVLLGQLVRPDDPAVSRIPICGAMSTM